MWTPQSLAARGFAVLAYSAVVAAGASLATRYVVGSAWRADYNGMVSKYERQLGDVKGASAAGWESALRIYKEVEAQYGELLAQKVARDAQVAALRRKFELATSEEGRCRAQASEPLYCPRPW